MRVREFRREINIILDVSFFIFVSIEIRGGYFKGICYWKLSDVKYWNYCVDDGEALHRKLLLKTNLK